MMMGYQGLFFTAGLHIVILLVGGLSVEALDSFHESAPLSTTQLHHASRTLFKHGPPMPNNSSNHTPLATPPLITACNVMPAIATQLSSAPNNILTCHSSPPPNCDRINCTILGTNDSLLIRFLRCSTPPALQVEVFNVHQEVLSNLTFAESGMGDINITNDTVPLDFTIVQHTHYLSMGLWVTSSSLGVLVPYTEIPVNAETFCPGGVAPPPMCAAMLDLATYLTVHPTLRAVQPWDCSLSHLCTNLTCVASSINSSAFFTLLLSSCQHSLTLVTPEFKRTFRRSEMVRVSNDTQFNVEVDYNASAQTLHIQVTVVRMDPNGTYSVPSIPYIVIPLNLSTCDAPLISTCDLFPQLAKVATQAVGDTLDCSPSPPPNCDQITCKSLSNGDLLSFRVLPCHAPPAIQLVNRFSNDTLRLNHTFTNTSMGFVAYVGTNPATLNVTIVQHPQMLTLGVGINATIILDDMPRPVDFVPYIEIPLNRTACRNPNITSTCDVTGTIAQYLNVLISNSTHSSSHCHVLHDSLCNNLTCTDYPTEGSSLNISFLPCGETIGLHIARGNASNVDYSFNVFNSTTVNISDTGSAAIMLEQGAAGEVAVQVDLFEQGNYSATAIPYVVVPVDTGVCHMVPPPANNTITFSPLFTTCDLMFHIAELTSTDALACSAAPPPNCDQVVCTSGNNESLSFRVLPCRVPPAMELVNRFSNGSVRFNKTLVKSTESVMAGLESRTVNMTVGILQRSNLLTLGFWINETIHVNGTTEAVPLVLYREIPLNRDNCPNHHNDNTATCRVMDNVAQAFAVSIANVSSMPYNCSVPRGASLCNTVQCESPRMPSFFTTFEACSNPIGMSTGGGISSDNFTIYSGGRYNFSNEGSSGFVDITFDQLGDGVVGYGIDVHVMYTNQKTHKPEFLRFVEVPYVRIPVNTSQCGERPPKYPSLIDTCVVLPSLAETANAILSHDNITCTSSVQPDCNTISCTVMYTGRTLEVTVVPCATPPAVDVAVVNGTLSGSPTRVNSSQALPLQWAAQNSAPLYFNIKQHESNLSLGLEVTATLFARGNVTLFPYMEIPLDRSACLPKGVMLETCEAFRNGSQYFNFIISNATREPTDCTVSSACDGLTCRVGSGQSSLAVSVSRCSIPPALRVVLTSPNGTLVINQTIADSDTLSWDVESAAFDVNVVVQHPDANHIGIQVTLDYPGNTRPYVMIPMIVPVNTTGCDTQPTYSNHSLISACDITPYIATSLLVPAEFGVLVCRASPAPNCSSITCAMPGSGDNVTFIVQPCYNPPAVTVHNYVNGSITVKQTFSHFLTFNFSSRNLPLNVSLIQHTDQMSLGFKVDITTADKTLIPFIPYREIPVNHFECNRATITPTCKVMSHVAQYLMVFLANLTTDVDSTPDCWANKHALCNNITCVEPAFNYSFFECEQPIGLSISIGSTPLESKPFYKSQPITLWGFVNSMLTLNTLSEDEVQFKIELGGPDFYGTLVPLVTVPLDRTLCVNGPTSTPTSSGNSKLLIEVAVPIGVVMAIVIAVLFVVLAYYCVRRKSAGDDSAYRPLSVHADEDDEEGTGDDSEP